MSVTFFCENDDTYLETYDCPSCCCPDLDIPECSECNNKGTIEIEKDKHSLNISQFNYRLLFEALGMPNADCYGTWEPAQLRQLHRLIEEAQNETHLPTREQSQGIGTRGAQWIDFGCPREQIESYLSRLQALVLVAIAKSSPIHWS